MSRKGVHPDLEPGARAPNFHPWAFSVGPTISWHAGFDFGAEWQCPFPYPFVRLAGAGWTPGSQSLRGLLELSEEPW